MIFLKKYIGLFFILVFLSACQGVTWHIKDIGELIGVGSDSKTKAEIPPVQSDSSEADGNTTIDKETDESKNEKDDSLRNIEPSDVTSEVGSESITIGSSPYTGNNSGASLNKEYQYYIVQTGDTLYSISRLFGVSIEVIKKTNNISENVVKVGSEILIPRNISGKKEAEVVGDVGETVTPTVKLIPNKNTNQSKIGSGTTENFRPPLVGNIMSNFGTVVDGIPLQGIVYSVKKGVEVKAARSGVVVYEGDQLPALGNMIIIKHDEEWLSLYANLDSILVTKGQSIRRGQEIGIAGNTGKVKRPQLYFEVRKDKVPVDPQTLFNNK